jgi:hypothetical protein
VASPTSLFQLRRKLPRKYLDAEKQDLLRALPAQSGYQFSTDLGPLFVRDGLEGGQISNAAGEELHFNLHAKKRCLSRAVP